MDRTTRSGAIPELNLFGELTAESWGDCASTAATASGGVGKRRHEEGSIGPAVRSRVFSPRAVSRAWGSLSQTYRALSEDVESGIVQPTPPGVDGSTAISDPSVSLKILLCANSHKSTNDELQVFPVPDSAVVALPVGRRRTKTAKPK